jgi:hypothetical protein
LFGSYCAPLCAPQLFLEEEEYMGGTDESKIKQARTEFFIAKAQNRGCASD